MQLYSPEVENSLPIQIDEIKCSTLQSSVRVEPSGGIESIDMQNLDLSFTGPQVKSEVDSLSELYEEMIDNMTLADRIKFRKSMRFSEQTTSSSSECFGKVVPFSSESSLRKVVPFSSESSLWKVAPLSSESSLVISESAKPRSVRRPKRKKTARGSVKEALEEDAPELLQVLVKEGILIDGIKLYGEAESDEALDESLDEGGFSELEEVMSKVFFHRNSSLKFPPIRCAKGSRPSYCLACLFSLVEQARYLQFRKWPVEWGWCRDLKSFIFVFERHKRIVLERPEYGYATYFFELVYSSPIEWQIKRLVTSMKLTSCGRITLLENKPLLVGEHLTEGEAKVLMEYGWIPNTGLGTMLNYCDRVVHDRKHEKDTSEWKSKIEKVLIDGFNGGSIVSTTLVDPVTKYEETENPQIKLEPE
ncbi:uncharacterized protein LOC110809728 [Carica papaya]|uniref:uncharacterized protein LOC110809728 n=1 Tax=Carica papaya TaxID=3649 RepID=UPI000B8C8C84|nr:uncharacterized protein LOC110809728 [Carica papaya]